MQCGGRKVCFDGFGPRCDWTREAALSARRLVNVTGGHSQQGHHPGLDGTSVQSEQHVREQLADAASTLTGYLTASGLEGEGFEYQQAHHWFFCLCSVLEFTRGEHEPIQSYIARAAQLSGQATPEATPAAPQR